MNPILPVRHFVPDAEARQWADGRMYIYGSYDFSGDTTYCSYEYHVFSSADLIHWEHHGESFRSMEPNSGVPWADSPLYAPDCIYHNGRYYLYFCLANGGEGVAVSDSPSGPFTDASPVAGADGDGIDPAVLVDDDGQVYYYWGQFHLRGAKLRPDLRAIEPESLRDNLLTEADHGFHEGASIRKRGDLYYLVYTDISRGRATSMAYATSCSPLGPFTKGGIILDNTGCDRETWNNHGSIAEFNGQWYIFYHRSSQASKFSRRACLEPIHFNEDGSIPEVEMTTQGASGPLGVAEPIPAWRACLLSGEVRTAAEGPDESGAPYREHLSHIHNQDWAAYKYVNFGRGATTFQARVGSLSYGGQIEIHLDQPDGPLVGVCDVPHTGGWQLWQTVSCQLGDAEGVRAVYLVFRGRYGWLFNLVDFQFA